MFYDFAITVTADTKEATPKTQELELCAGMIHKIVVGFQDGCNHMVKVKLLHREHQVIPLNPDGYVADNDYNVVIDTFIDLSVQPHTLKVVAYSPDTDFDHTIFVRVYIFESEELGLAERIFLGMIHLLKFFRIL
jgi:hypothetical protein